MLEAKLEAALNTQINHEIGSAYNYLAMAAHCERQNLSGFASWMMVQRTEELDHAQRLYRYVLDRGGVIDLGAIARPRCDYGSVRDVFNHALEMEQANTAAIHDLYGLAVDARDYATQSHLQWFLDEQVEEEKTMNEVLALVEMAGDEKSAMLVLNSQMAQRNGSGTGTDGGAGSAGGA